MNVNIPSQKNTTTLPLHVFLPADIRLAQDISSRLTIWDILIFLITSSWTLLWILRSYHRPGKNPYHDFFYSVPQANEVSAKDKNKHGTSRRNIGERMREVIRTDL